ncbi:NADAR family protein [Labrys sp. WJW]|uniref:NADAR family protein n=1 Tax=Labrys sp. WJW TaxID=1737983 RepID=UPI0009EF4B06|nr:NADAR family protein [Labrys sp. WJW]
MLENEIKFNSKSKEYNWLSNFYECNICLEDKIWLTVEHYFQSMKFLDKDYQNTIRLAPSAKEAKILGKSRKYAIHDDWDIRRISIMETALKAKFSDPILRKKLIDTYPKFLIESSMFDYFWGSGKNGKGKNVLGNMLINLREELLAKT